MYANIRTLVTVSKTDINLNHAMSNLPREVSFLLTESHPGTSVDITDDDKGKA